MTFIALATYGDSAEILADTATYSHAGRDVRYVSKIHTILHLNAAIATQGDATFGQAAKLGISHTEAGRDFDEVMLGAPEAAREAWQYATEIRGTGIEARVFAVGFSPSAGEFRAFRFLAEHDFEAEPIDEFSYYPASIHHKPEEWEMAQLRKQFGDDPSAASELDKWEAKPRAAKPIDVAGWGKLAFDIRENRALITSPAKVFVAGQLHRAQLLANGEISMNVAYDFNDTGLELDHLVYGTLHPRAQVLPCPCGSGQPGIDCCLAKRADDPCSCARAKTFGECCMITPEGRQKAESAPTLYTD